MNKQNSTPEPPESLSLLYKTDSDAFTAMVKSLRQSGWPLSVLANHLSVSKTTISRWEKKNTTLPLPPTPQYPDSPVLTPTQAQELADLNAKACQVRRYTPASSPNRKAQSRLESLLLDYHQQGVTVSALARYCNVTRRAIYQRLEKYEDS